MLQMRRGWLLFGQVGGQFEPEYKKAVRVWPKETEETCSGTCGTILESIATGLTINPQQTINITE